MRRLITNITLSLTLISASNILASTFELTSTDISNNKLMSNAQEFQGFGCQGGNTSPQLSWSGAPEKTKAFAILVHDPDAPTGSGWWHWQVINIPKHINTLGAGAGKPSKNLLPIGITTIKNDYGNTEFGGACPPKGHGTHRYRFTIYALSQKLDLPESASGALTSYMVKTHSLASSTIEALYKRD